MSESSYTISDPFPIRPIEIVLGHLDRVKRSGPNRWQARCPAHDDHTPSLSVTERDDGSVRLKCFAGCDWLDIAAAIGLRGCDLYPDEASGFVRQDHHPGRVQFPRAASLEGDGIEAIVSEAWQREHGAAWQREYDQQAQRLEGRFRVRARFRR